MISLMSDQELAAFQRALKGYATPEEAQTLARFVDWYEDALQDTERKLNHILPEEEGSKIVTAYNSAGDVCWMCELCATTVPCADGDPLPDGWQMGHTPQGPGPICAECEEKG